MRFQSLDAWLDWQASSHPVEIDLGLDRVRAVAERLDVLRPAVKVVTVAGTNGKGSSVALLEGVLERAGYRTGCYTSPHITHYRERIRIDGDTVNDANIVDAFNAIDEARGDVSLTYFEWSTLAGLWLFKQAGVDVALLEVGLGGRLDAVNIVDADVALMTSIGIDHTEWLGDTRELICHEKAGVARQGRPLVCADLDPPAACMEQLRQRGVEVLIRSDAFDIELFEDHWAWRGPTTTMDRLPFLALQGKHQIDNAAGVLMVLEKLDCKGISQAVIGCALQEVTLNGRFERISGAFEVVLDVAHNADGSRRLAAALESQVAVGQTWCLLGVLADKDARNMLDALAGVVDHWVLVSPDSPRALPLDELERLAQSRSTAVSYEVADSVEVGYELVRQHLTLKDRLVVTGSFYTVGQIKAVLQA